MSKKDTINFIKTSVEFFKSDYYLLYDFLVSDTPWDRCMTYKLGITEKDLQEYKESFICGVISTYQKLLKASMEKGQINIVDYKVANKAMNGTPLNNLFFEDAESYLVMMKFYIYALRDEVEIKKDTFNENKVLLADIWDLYYNLLQKYNLNDDEVDTMSLSSSDDYEQRFNTFRQELYTEICKLFQNTFRSVEEEQQFINYIYSLAYARLYIDKEHGLDLDSEELAVMSVIEAEVDARESFYYNGALGIIAIELLINLCDNYWPHIDIRRAVDDDEIQKYFSNLDDNYDNKFDNDIIITDYSVDSCLDEILSIMLDNMNYDEIYHTLTSNECIYDMLMDNNLDGRYEEYFKYLMICKILSDTFEYESYLNATSDNVDATINYQNLLKMKINKTNIIKYFEDHATFLIEKYHEYHSSKTTVEKARLHVANMKEDRIVTKIFSYASINYMLLKLCKVVPMASVDYINKVVLQVRDNTGFDYFSEDKDTTKLLQSMCLSVYENLLLDQNIDEEGKKIISFLETSENLISSLQSNPNMLTIIMELFNSYNQEETTYKEELDRRASIKETQKIKILNKLNPFANIEN